jgi:hypothetical protein
MGYNAPVPSCPRCGTPFPYTERVCRGCGLTQEVAQDPFWRSGAASSGDGQQQANDYQGQSPYNPAGQQPGGYGARQAAAPPNDPFAQARGAQAYRAPQYQYASADAPKKRSFWLSPSGLSLIAFLLLMVIGASAFAIYYYPMLCSAQERNNLRSDMPLPCGVTFVKHLDRSASGTTGPGSDEWVYTVDGQSPAQLTSFYQNKLPGKGWTLPSTIQDVAGNHLAACQGSVVALINSTDKPAPEADFTFQPPSGGSLLLIIFAPTKNLISQVQEACAST